MICEKFYFDSPLARLLPSIDEYRARGDNGKGSGGPPKAAPSCSGPISQRPLILRLTSQVGGYSHGGHDRRACSGGWWHGVGREAAPLLGNPVTLPFS